MHKGQEVEDYLKRKWKEESENAAEDDENRKPRKSKEKKIEGKIQIFRQFNNKRYIERNACQLVDNGCKSINHWMCNDGDDCLVKNLNICHSGDANIPEGVKITAYKSEKTWGFDDDLTGCKPNLEMRSHQSNKGDGFREGLDVSDACAFKFTALEGYTCGTPKC